MTNKTAVFNEIEKLCQASPEQLRVLENYVDLLLKENNKYNLIGKSTIDDSWNRHILDSAQIMPYITNKNAKIADFGTGAGLPGVVISILGVKEVHLIEKSFRKCEFLRQAKLLSPNRIYIHQAKLEELPEHKFDVIVSRALASLDKLLAYSQKFLKNDGYTLFLKGKNLPAELEIAQKQFNFSYELFPSITSQESRIIKISGISTK